MPTWSAFSSPCTFGTRAGNATSASSGRLSTSRRTWSEPFIMGTHLGDTNAPASMARMPAYASISMSLIFISTVISVAVLRFCRPSRGDTSTILTNAGTRFIRAGDTNGEAGGVGDAGRSAGLAAAGFDAGDAEDAG
eukprot:Amastigsp_a677102_82.p3 type:complete len:137 gc:universal Amastigsp_a677102_82:799-1209(+)